MNGLFEWRKKSVCWARLLVILSVFFMMNPSYADPLKDLQTGLPRDINGWLAEPEDRLYDSETIFEYIDGAGEVYRAYNMKTCVSRRYTRPDGPAIVLDIFHMGSSLDAFGVFTHDQDGDPIGIGQGALYRPGWLSFWKDRFFVSIYAEEEREEAEKAVKILGQKVASLIPSEGPRPAILSKLPPGGLVERSTHYFHDPVVLNYHYYLSDENILDLGHHVEAVLAKYERGKEKARLLLLTYPGEEEAGMVFSRILKHYLPESKGGEAVQIENRIWCAARWMGRGVALILEADTRQLAEDLLTDVRKGG